LRTLESIFRWQVRKQFVSYATQVRLLSRISLPLALQIDRVQEIQFTNSVDMPDFFNTLVEHNVELFP
jgi:hypothetical protein